MKKILCLMFILLGVFIIGTGIFLQLNNEEETKPNNEKESTTNQTFEKINSFNLEEICTTYNEASTYINTSDYTKISFNYPSCVHEYDLSFWYKILENEDHSLTIDVGIERDTLANYMNDNKDYFLTLKEIENTTVNYTDVKTITTKNNLNISILQGNYQTKNTYATDTYELWYIATKIDDETILTYKVQAKEYSLSYKAIEELFNNIKIEKEMATIKNSKEDGEYQIGTIKQNFKDSYEHGYKINYKVSKSYPEVASLGANVNKSIFSYEDTSKKSYVEMSIKNDTYDKFMNEINESKKIALTSYQNDTTRYRNSNDTGIIPKTINDKDIYYYIYSYDYYLNDEKTSQNYLGQVFYEIKPHLYLEIYISNTNIEVNEEFISTFLNFTTEEY